MGNVCTCKSTWPRIPQTGLESLSQHMTWCAMWSLKSKTWSGRSRQIFSFIKKKKIYKIWIGQPKAKRDCRYNHTTAAQLVEGVTESLCTAICKFRILVFYFTFSRIPVVKRSRAALHMKVNNEQRQSTRRSRSLSSCPAELYGNCVLFPTSERMLVEDKQNWCEPSRKQASAVLSSDVWSLLFLPWASSGTDCQSCCAVHWGGYELHKWVSRFSPLNSFFSLSIWMRIPRDKRLVSALKQTGSASMEVSIAGEGRGYRDQ